MTKELFTWISVAVVMAGGVAAIYWVRNRDSSAKGPRRAKREGSSAGVLRLLRYTAANISGKVLESVQLQKGEETITLDGVLVGCFGVYALQCYGYNGQIFGNPQEAQWLWVSADKREPIQNPVRQAAAATRLLRETLTGAGVRNPQCEVEFVFTDAKAELCVPRSVSPMKLPDLRRVLRREKFCADKGCDVEKLYSILAPYAKK